jgi:L,D-transpeptidase ErfK/SrfK
MPSNQESVIGQVQYGAVPTGENNVAKLNHHFDIGYNEIIEANPDINFSKPVRSGTTLKVPTQYLLPNHPREGIVVNLPEMRMYYYQPESGQISTYPIGIGKIGKTIPLAQAKITRKTKNPTWIPTPDIREFNLSQGIVLPQIMPAGPDNPLGPYAIYMTIPTYLMHSTIFPESIGKRASFGCIRMYQSDIESFFPVVTPGIPVAIINSPTKVAWQKNHLFMEAHPPLEEHNKEFTATLPGTVTQIEQLTKQKNVLVDWQAVAFIENARDGLPHEIGMKIVR